jgi:UDP-N-acetylmuramoylalanine--D-glutamate ligase
MAALDSGWRGKRVTVMGLGTRGGGTGVVRFLAERGAIVTVTDLRSADELSDQITALADLHVRYVLERHDERDFVNTDVVVRNPAVRRWNPLLAAARAAGVPIEMEMTIFLAESPAPVIGITGTKGKTSSSVLCGDMLRAWNPETVVAGNMGVSAVAALDQLTPQRPVVLELSSWQLEAMDEREIGPNIAIITNISPDHLDTYVDFAEYAAVKRSIVHHLGPDDVAVLNADDPEVNKAARETRARVVTFGVQPQADGIRVFPDHLESSIPEAPGSIAMPDHDAIRGLHMRMNIAAAACAALLRGASIEHVQAGVNAYRGIANRMERVGTIDGVMFINDTAATAPAAAIASLEAMSDRPVHLIAGGADKNLDMTGLAEAIAKSARSVTLLDGTATGLLADLIHHHAPTIDLPVTQSMPEAIETALRHACPGDIVLLSPGCASFGIFRDEFDRGQQFRDWVNAHNISTVTTS